MSDRNSELTTFFEASFRRLRPHRLGAEILTLCREMAEEMTADDDEAVLEESLHD